MKIKNYMIFLVFASLLLFEFVPSLWNDSDYLSIISLSFVAVINLVIINKFRNIYWFVSYNYLLLWIPLLLFGSASETLIKTMFAATYNTWEGFLEVKMILSGYMVHGFIISASIIMLIFRFLQRGKITSFSSQGH